MGERGERAASLTPNIQVVHSLYSSPLAVAAHLTLPNVPLDGTTFPIGQSWPPALYHLPSFPPLIPASFRLQKRDA